jgi:RND family efflux transporter MFP subunit
MRRKSSNGKSLREVCLVFFLYLTILLFTPIHLAFGQPPKAKASPVVVEKVLKKNIRPLVSLIGTATPYRKSTVAPETEGLVLEFPVKKGQRIKKGDVLVKIEKKPLLLQLKIAEANLEEVKENYKNAMSELNRMEALFKKRSVSSSEYDQKLFSSNALKSKMVALEAKIESIRYDVNKCTVRAPFSGFVVEEHTQVGQWLKKGDEAVTIVEINPILVTLPVPDRYIHFIKIKQRVNLEFDFLPGEKIKRGIIQRLVPEGNEKSRSFPVQIRVKNNDFIILAGMSCKVSFPVGKPFQALLVNKDAIVTGEGSHTIFAVRGGKVASVPVKKGRAYEGLVVVEGAISEGEMVVVEGNERLRPGQSVRAVVRDQG